MYDVFHDVINIFVKILGHLYIDVHEWEAPPFLPKLQEVKPNVKTKHTYVCVILHFCHVNLYFWELSNISSQLWVTWSCLKFLHTNAWPCLSGLLSYRESLNNVDLHSSVDLRFFCRPESKLPAKKKRYLNDSFPCNM